MSVENVGEIACVGGAEGATPRKLSGERTTFNQRHLESSAHALTEGVKACLDTAILKLSGSKTDGVGNCSSKSHLD